MDKVVHFEIPADDLERAKKFYQSVFGWQIDSIPQMDYTMVQTVPTDEKNMPKEPGAINGGMYKRTEAGEPTTIVVGVSSIDDYLQKIEKAGGKILVAKQAVADMGFYGRVEDTEGNIFGLWETTTQ